MAWLELHRNGNYHVVFRSGGSKFRRSLKTSNEREAKGCLTGSSSFWPRGFQGVLIVHRELVDRYMRDQIGLWWVTVHP